jgi:hypothetical protein
MRQSLNLSQFKNLHQPQIEQLTGCKYAVFTRLVDDVKVILECSRRGRPFAQSVSAMVLLTLMKVRLNLTVRSMEAITGVDSVTVARSINRVIEIIGKLPLASRSTGMLVVDTSSIRVATTDTDSYSGHKHQRCAKVQVKS